MLLSKRQPTPESCTGSLVRREKKRQQWSFLFGVDAYYLACLVVRFSISLFVFLLLFLMIPSVFACQYFPPPCFPSR